MSTSPKPVDAFKPKTEAALQYLTFSLCDETFAMDIRAVPLMPDFVRGVINLRGVVVPVIGLPPQFGTSIQREYIRGLGKVDDEFVVILETDRALSIDDMALIADQAALA